MNGEQAEMQRADRIAILARATLDELELAWDCLPEIPPIENLRGPEVAMVMASVRESGEGSEYNLGEVIVSRAAVRLASGKTGYAHVLDDDKRRAWLGAVFDAFAQQRGGLSVVALSLIHVVRQRIALDHNLTFEATVEASADILTGMRWKSC